MPCSRRARTSGPAPPQFRLFKPLDQDFRAAGQPGQRIEIARIEDQRAGHELVQGQPPAAIEGWQVRRQPPAGVERPAVNDDAKPAQQRLEPGERGHRVHFVG